LQALLQSVYSRYPWYTINSELQHVVLRDRPSRPIGETAIYTSGYEGRSIDDFYNNLIRAGIRTVIDVRFNPVSRKYGFAGSSLSRIGRKLGFDYIHIPNLGISGEKRTELSDFASYQRLLDRYSRTFLPTCLDDLYNHRGLMQKTPSVLVCMERDVNCCHRGRLAITMAEQTGLPVIHL
jgi:uncharacterized protein (DUF488 family)